MRLEKITKRWELFLKTNKTEDLIFPLYNVIVSVVKCRSDNVSVAELQIDSQLADIYDR